MIVRKTTAEEGKRVNELFAVAFEQNLENGPAEEEETGICHWAAFTDDTNEMMSTFSISDFSIQFDGHVCKMGGIGGVATLPQYRRRGGIRGCFERALPDMYREGYDFSYLYPFSTAYYRKFGYENCVRKYQTTVDLGLLNPPAATGSFRMAEPGDTMTEEIRLISREWEQKYNMMVISEDSDYEWADKTDPCGTLNFCYVYKNGEGAPRAYTVFHMENQSDGRNLVCTKFRFLDKDGFAGLMHLFKSLAADHRLLKFELPAEPAMQYLMAEWSMGAASWTLSSGGMVRVVRVQDVLKKARYIGSGSICLEIRDPQIPENNGCFAVRFENGTAVSAEKTEQAPDAVLSIPSFSAMISGICTFEEAAMWLDGVEIRNHGACFSQVFYRKNLMITSYF